MGTLGRLIPESPTRAWNGRVARVVPIKSMFPQGRTANADYLYTSGKENRYNPAGMACLYMSLEETTARAEFRRQFRGLSVGAHQPVCSFFADLVLRRVLDARDGATLAHLSLTFSELESDWGYGLPPSVSQRLAKAACGVGIEAILYRSVAAVEEGLTGSNIVLFRDNIRHPSHVRILGSGDAPLGQWP